MRANPQDPRMPPCVDVYVWLPRPDAGLLSHFIERYVKRDIPGDERLWRATETLR